MIDLSWQLFLVFAIVIGVSMIPMESFAAANAIQNTLCKVVGLFTSTTGKAIATLAVIIVGVGALMGKVSWGLALIVALGIALVFGAASIVDAIDSTGNTKNCP
jgi:type IV secretion system protein VirB2